MFGNRKEGGKALGVQKAAGSVCLAEGQFLIPVSKSHYQAVHIEGEHASWGVMVPELDRLTVDSPVCWATIANLGAHRPGRRLQSEAG